LTELSGMSSAWADVPALPFASPKGVEDSRCVDVVTGLGLAGLEHVALLCGYKSSGGLPLRVDTFARLWGGSQLVGAFRIVPRKLFPIKSFSSRGVRTLLRNGFNVEPPRS